MAQFEVLSIRSVMSYVSSECTVPVRMHMNTLIRFRISDNDVQNSNSLRRMEPIEGASRCRSICRLGALETQESEWREGHNVFTRNLLVRNQYFLASTCSS